MAKCKISDNPEELEFCAGMKKYVQRGGNPKGLRLVVLFSLRTGNSRVGWVSYHGSAKDEGVVLNVCPFCGENLLPPKTAAQFDD